VDEAVSPVPKLIHLWNEFPGFSTRPLAARVTAGGGEKPNDNGKTMRRRLISVGYAAASIGILVGYGFLLREIGFWITRG
jgi:hypothetical protein